MCSWKLYLLGRFNENVEEELELSMRIVLLIEERKRLGKRE